jgi:hypothetical protein
MIGNWQEDVYLLAVGFICIGALLLIAYDEMVVNPERADNALFLCQERGYESYLDYAQKPFDTKPYGLRCGNPRMDYDITVHDGDPPKSYREGYL